MLLSERLDCGKKELIRKDWRGRERLGFKGTNGVDFPLLNVTLD